MPVREMSAHCSSRCVKAYTDLYVRRPTFTGNDRRLLSYLRKRTQNVFPRQRLLVLKRELTAIVSYRMDDSFPGAETRCASPGGPRACEKDLALCALFECGMGLHPVWPMRKIVARTIRCNGLTASCTGSLRRRGC